MYNIVHKEQQHCYDYDASSLHIKCLPSIEVCY